MSQTAAPIQDAPAPFSGQHDPDDRFDVPDLIVPSGDGFDLHVHRAILKFVSIFFRNMLDGAGSATDLHRDEKPVVVLPEPCADLHRLLCLAYPGSVDHYSLTAQNLDGVWAVHEAADKYVFTGVLELLERMLANPILIEAHPHRIFAIARLRHLPSVPAGKFQELYEFHHARGKAAEAMVNANSGPLDAFSFDASITRDEDGHYEFIWWVFEGGSDHTGDCGPDIMGYDGDYDMTPAPWFKTHIEIFTPKLRTIPSRHTIETKACNLADAARAVIKSCQPCREHAERHLFGWRYQLARRIEASNEKIGESFRTSSHTRSLIQRHPRLNPTTIGAPATDYANQISALSTPA
ncbi:hypothetical protein B0H19DRAFT_1378992 [Mycena capillaripes]|nr:hypothetical protein B0H19DRAFT_1378992 [Mycena capillaripes]